MVAGVIVLAVLAVLAVRTTPSGCWLVVSRFGRVVRVADSGLVLRLPFIERCNSLPRTSLHLPITVSARTRDAVPVHLLATAVVRIVDPAVAAGCADPVGSAAGTVQTALAQLISRVETADLLAFRTKPVTEESSRLSAEFGLAVDMIVVDGIETELTPGLLGLAPTHTKYRNQT
ncbi:SPFH domain-containing protein [Kribbella sp. VKM Ac-2568]|uniref:SPFH domain-containing protein n=1 Tax=Kribbella sp. VKM Ac-2568 TaxID=2512219 RepID=UPI0013054841|nr:SPFH domain-containing protein [Kribbella sp. VKM Ac-2568]